MFRLPSFAGCQSQDTRQIIIFKKVGKPFAGCWPPAKKFEKKNLNSLPGASDMAPGKESAEGISQ
jgi:hypothetical protein